MCQVSGPKTLTNFGQYLPFFVSGVTNRVGCWFEKVAPRTRSSGARALSAPGVSMPE